MAEHRDLEGRSIDELEEMVRAGDLSQQQVDEILRERMRREAANREPDELPNSTHRTTAGGFGSGQGMGTERTGQEPNRPDEQGEPRGEDQNWPL